MFKYQKLMFGAFFILVVFSVTVCKGLCFLNVPLPDVLGVGAERSNLEARTYQKFPKPKVKSVMHGEFQDDFEQYVADLVPRRDGALLFNASWQRGTIAGAAAVCGYSVYPTFYGSTHVYDSKDDVIAPKNKKKTNGWREKYNRSAEIISKMAQDNRDKRIVLCEVDRSDFSSANPAYKLMTAPIDRDWVREQFLGNLNPSIGIVDCSIDNKEELLEEYYRTDHHWHTKTAYTWYVEMLRALDPTLTAVTVTGTVSYDDVPFYGSYSRVGLCKPCKPDYIDDILYTASDIAVIADGKHKTMGDLVHRSMYEKGTYSDSEFKGRYGEYFHGGDTVLELRNKKAQSKKTLLMVADSSSNSIERLFPESYSVVYCVDPRASSSTMREFIDAHHVDDILFLVSGYTYTSDEFEKFMR